MASFNWPAAGGGGGGVSSLETLVGDITIVGGTNISVSDNGTNEITISTTTTNYIASVSDTTTINLTVTGDVLSSDVNADSLTNVEINSAAGIVYSKLSLTDSIINADINSAAGIVYSKLDLTGSIVNADVDAAAAIVYSKLSLTDSIVNADINSAAAIAYSKLNLAGSIQDSDINTALTYSVLDLSDSIVNADINSAAAIAYSKLALTDSIVNADINSAAAIAYSKLDLTGSVDLTSDVTGILPLANGGTGSATQNFVDLTTDQSIAGDKKFLNELLLNENTAGAFVSGTFDTSTSVVSVFTSGSGTLEGLSGKVDQVAILVNNSSNDITVENDSASASAGNKIITGSGSDIQWKDGATLFFVNANETWNLVGGTGSGSGSVSGGINYILNPDAEVDLTGWIDYGDTAGPVPVTGNGTGSPRVVLSRSTTSPLRGDAQFLLTKDAANRQGTGASYNFTIDEADVSQVVRISFDYEAVSGTFNYNAGTPSEPSDIAVYVYDVTNDVLIYPSQSFLNGSGKLVSEFQTNAGSTSYRLILHCATTNAAAWEWAFDNVQVGPRDIAKGPIVTDWISYTPTFTGFGTVSVQNSRYRRIGDSIEVESTFTAGTPTAVTAKVSLPNGLSVKTGLPTLSTSGIWLRGETATAHGGSTIKASGDTGIFFGSPQTFGNGSVNSIGKELGNNLIGTGAIISLKTFLPIEGWSSNIKQSTDFGSRVIAGNFYRNAVQSIPDATDTTVILDSTTLNTGGLSLNTGTGVVTIQESGLYNLIGQTRVDNLDDLDRNICRIQVNGVSVAEFTSYSANANDAPTSTTSTISQLMAGDEVVLVVYQDSGTSNNLSNSSVRTFLAINKIQSPQTLMGGEVVAARYTTNAGQLIPNTLTYTVVNFDDKVFDTHNAVTIGASWRFTAPISGKYSVDAKLELGSSNWTAENAFQMNVFKEGVDYARIGDWRAIVTYTNGIPALINGATTVDLDAGEYIDVQTRHNGDSGSVGLAGASIVCYIDIFKVN